MQLFSADCPAAQTSPELIFHIMNMSQDSSVSLSVKCTEQEMHACKKKIAQFTLDILPIFAAVEQPNFLNSTLELHCLVSFEEVEKIKIFV